MHSFVPPDGLDGPWVKSSIDFPFELVSKKSERTGLSFKEGRHGALRDVAGGGVKSIRKVKDGLVELLVNDMGLKFKQLALVYCLCLWPARAVYILHFFLFYNFYHPRSAPHPLTGIFRFYLTLPDSPLSLPGACHRQ